MTTLVHGACIDFAGIGVLLCGPSGGGKSDLALRMIEDGARLVADDQVELTAARGALRAAAPAALRGRLEVRGVGIVEVAWIESTTLRLAVDLVGSGLPDRLPEPSRRDYLGIGLPCMALSPFEPSAPAKLRLAVDGIKRRAAGAARAEEAPAPGEEASAAPGVVVRQRVLLVTGMSGAGKTAALKALEDIGFEAVDNLPLSLLASLVRPPAGSARALSIGVDIRTRDFEVAPFLRRVEELADDRAAQVRLLFLDCRDDVLQRRFSETRRRHPLAGDRPPPDGIARERRLVTPLRDRADVVIDTSNLRLGDLKRILQGHFAPDASARLTVFVTSFSYRRGLPPEADIVLDVRFLANPHYRPALRALTGRDEAVAAFVAADEGFAGFFEHVARMLEHALPRYAREGKSYLTIAAGCTGGRHRSVFVAERLAAWLRARGERVGVAHRDLPLDARSA